MYRVKIKNKSPITNQPITSQPVTNTPKLSLITVTKKSKAQSPLEGMKKYRGIGMNRLCHHPIGLQNTDNGSKVDF